ncbi:hypothetical protein Tco_1489161, partial [Tanacetum coccineum]
VVVALVVLWRRWGGGGGVDVVMMEMKVVVLRGVGWDGRALAGDCQKLARKDDGAGNLSARARVCKR